MSNCNDILHYLDAYIDGTLEARYRSTVDHHLAQCQTCRLLFEEFGKTRAILMQLDEVDPPPWLAEKVMGKITGQDKKKGFFAQFFYPLHIKIPVQALAAALVLVISGYVYKSTLPEIQNIRPPVHTSGPAAGSRTDIKPETQARKDIMVESKQKGVEPAQKNKPAPDIPLREATPSPQSPDHASGYAKSEAAPQKPEMYPEQSDSHRLQDRQPADVSRFREKAQAFKVRAAPSLENDAPQSTASLDDSPVRYPANYVAILAENPALVSRKTISILRSLGATSVQEKTGNEHVVITGHMNPKSFADLKAKLSHIAVVTESKAAESGPGANELILIEISIGKYTGDREK